MRRLIAAFAVTAAVVGLIGLAKAGPAVQAAQVTLEGVATGADENPPVTGPGTVRVRFVFDDVAKTLQYQATVNGMSIDQVTASHIHRAPRGTNGPIVHNLSLVPFIQIAGTITLSDADIADLRAGNLYFNAHSKDNPGGFARFQLVLPAAAQPTAAATTTAAVRPPSTGEAGLLEQRRASWLPFAALLVAGLAGIGGLALATRRA